MSNKSQYMQLLTRQDQLQNQWGNLKEEINSFVLTKLRNLQMVGRLVVQKSLGQHWTTVNGEFLGDLSWVLGKIDILELTPEHIAVVCSNNQHYEEISLERNIIHKSDRDFASMVRSRIHQHKSHLARQQLIEARTEIRELERIIHDCFKKRDQLTTLQEQYKKTVNDLVNYTNQRTHKKLKSESSPKPDRRS
jgi:hypothetical protein